MFNSLSCKVHDNTNPLHLLLKPLWLCQIHPFQPTMVLSQNLDQVGLGILKPQENIRNPCPPSSLDPTNSQAHDWSLSTLHLDPSLTKWFLNALASVGSGPYVVDLISQSEKGSTPGSKGRNFDLPSVVQSNWCWSIQKEGLPPRQCGLWWIRAFSPNSQLHSSP